MAFSHSVAFFTAGVATVVDVDAAADGAPLPDPPSAPP